MMTGRVFTISAAILFSNTELEKDADEEKIKLAYRRLAKFYHPDGMFFHLILMISER